MGAPLTRLGSRAARGGGDAREGAPCTGGTLVLSAGWQGMEGTIIIDAEGSSCLAYAEYDPETQILYVEFASRRRGYEYLRVPQDVVVAFQAAGSKGTFVNEVIKRRFEYREVERRIRTPLPAQT
jgi:hypothetical protein